MKIRASVCVLLYISTCVFFRNFYFVIVSRWGWNWAGVWGSGTFACHKNQKLARPRQNRGLAVDLGVFGQRA